MSKIGSVKMPVELETPRLRLRHFTLDDVDRMAAMNADPETMRFMWSGTRKREQVENGIRTNRTKAYPKGIGFLAVVDKASDEVIGQSGIVPEHGEIAIGYLLRKDYWGRGLAAEATRALVVYGFETLELASIWASTNVEHRASQRVMEKLGMCFQHEGPIRDLGTAAFYAVTRAEFFEKFGRDATSV